MTATIAADPVRRLIRSGGAFIALATVLMSLYGIPALSGVGLGLVGWAVSAVLALLCVGVVIDRLRLIRGR